MLRFGSCICCLYTRLSVQNLQIRMEGNHQRSREAPKQSDRQGCNICKKESGIFGVLTKSIFNQTDFDSLGLQQFATLSCCLEPGEPALLPGKRLIVDT